MPTNLEVLKMAREWVGTPYHAQACVKGHGVDCAQLAVGVARELGLIDELAPEYRAYGPLPQPERIESGLMRYCEQIPKAEALPGDILYLWWTRGIGQHIGVLSDLHGRGIIHATQSEGAVIEVPLNDALWRCVKSVWRLRGVTA